MLLVEKLIKLLDDFHYDVFRDYVKNMSIRSYYPLALIDVIDRDLEVEQDSEYLFRATYGDDEVGEKEMKKFFQLAHYTFRLSGFLAKNYPDYLHSNISRIQKLINTGQLKKSEALIKALSDFCEKVEDHDTHLGVLSLIAHKNLLLESPKLALECYQKMEELLAFKKDFNDINLYFYQHFKEKGKENTAIAPQDILAFHEPYFQSKSFKVRIVSHLNYAYALYLLRDKAFYDEFNFKKLEFIEDELQKYDYIVFPYLFNIRPKLSLLKLNYSLRKLSNVKVLDEAAKIIDESQDDLFWNSFINLPEINSIAIQTSHLVTKYFKSYQKGHLALLPPEIVQRIDFLKGRCRAILDNKLLEEAFIVKYINLTTIYAGLLLLGDEEDIHKSIETLENLLIFYQQVAFHAYIDPIYLNLIMGGMCLRDFDKVEKSYRRYKKSTKGKVVNPENDLVLHGFYYICKWMETSRNQYVKKLSNVLEETREKRTLKSTRELLLDVVEYIKMPIPLDFLEKNN